MDSAEIQAELDKVQPIVQRRPFMLYDSPLPFEQETFTEIRVHWHDEQKRWIYCTRESCSRTHVHRQVRYLKYVDEGHEVDYRIVVAPPMLLRTEQHWRPGDALMRLGTGIQTQYCTVDREHA
jgi:hypothetical protein